MDASSLRELGLDLMDGRQFLRALGVFGEAVHRLPEDHRARMLAARCYVELGERERAVLVLQACAEGLLRRDYLLSAMAACKLALDLNPHEKMVKETLRKVHGRAMRAAVGRATVPPPLPVASATSDLVTEDLMALQGSEVAERALEILITPDLGRTADPEARPPLPLFADLSEDAFVELVVGMEYRTLTEGVKITEEGMGGEALYVLVAGQADVSRHLGGEPRKLGVLGGGSMFGEVSLLTGTLPSATVTTRIATDIFEVKRELLNQLAKNHPTVPQVLADFAQQRMARNLLATSPLFAPLPEAERASLLQHFHFRALVPNERALVEGEHSAGLFLVLAGELMVQKEDPSGGVVSLGILHEGDVAGEIGLLTGLRATATVLATRKTATAFLPRAAFDELMKTFPRSREFLQTLSDRRLKQIGEALRPPEVLDADELVLDASSAEN